MLLQLIVSLFSSGKYSPLQDLLCNPKIHPHWFSSHCGPPIQAFIRLCANYWYILRRYLRPLKTLMPHRSLNRCLSGYFSDFFDAFSLSYHGGRRWPYPKASLPCDLVRTFMWPNNPAFKKAQLAIHGPIIPLNTKSHNPIFQMVWTCNGMDQNPPLL